MFANTEVAAPTWSGAQGGAAPGQQAMGSGYERFSFRNVFGRLELRSLLREDVDRIKAQVDVQALTKHVENIAFSDVRLDDVRNMSDEDFVKVRPLTLAPAGRTAAGRNSICCDPSSSLVHIAPKHRAMACQGLSGRF